MTKAELRRNYRALPESERIVSAQLSETICAAIQSHPVFLNASRVGIFAPRPEEPNLKPLWLARPQAVALPKCRPQSDLMDFFLIKGWEDLSPGFKGILEPPSGVPVSFSTTDLILVPGLGFDSSGGRVGSGRGFYDRFLATNPAICWGVCQSSQVSKVRLAQEATDVRMWAIVTEKGVQVVS